MSSLSKFLSMVVVICAAFGSGYSSDVVLEFRLNDNYFVQCGGSSKLFNNTEELSDGVNSITNPNFSVNFITKNGSVLTFNDMRSGNNGYYKLV